MKLISLPLVSRSPAPGFTIIEVVVTLLVAGMLTALAVPAFNNFILNDRDVGQVNSLASSLMYARSEAIKRASPNGIEVCPSTDGATCGGTGWSGGWIVLDLNPADIPPANLLQAVPAMAGANTMTATGSPGGVIFYSSGLSSGVLAVRVCDARGASYARDVEVNSTGRIASSQSPGLSVAGTSLVCP